MAPNDSSIAWIGIYVHHLLGQRYIFTMYIIIPGTLSLFGLIGNLVAFVTLGKMANKNAITFLLRALAIIDSCVLISMQIFLHSYCLTLYVEGGSFYVEGWDQIASTYIMPCIVPLLYTATMANVWTSVVIGINRYIAVCHPLHAARLCTTSNGRKQIVAVVLGSIVYCVPKIFEWKISRTADGIYTLNALIENNELYYYIYAVGCHLVFRFIIPFGMLLFFCVRLTSSLRAARNQPRITHRGHLGNTRITVMLIILIGIFIACYAPNFLYRILVVFYIHGFYFTSSQLVIRIVQDIARILIMVNSCTNWFIYFAYMKEFRKKQCAKCAPDTVYT